MGLKSLKVFGAGVSGDLRFLGAEFSQIPVVNFPNSGSELKSRFAFGKSNFVFGKK